MQEKSGQSEEGVWNGIGKFAWASGSGRAEVCGSCEKISGGEGREERGTRLLGARSSAELRQVTSGSVAQDLWLGNRKMRSQVVGKDQSRLSGRRTAGEIRR